MRITELSKLSIWFKANKLSLNINKTNYIIFGHKGKNIGINIQIDGQKIERVTSTKFLGLQIDENLNWKEHVRLISNKISRGLGIIYRLRRSIPSYVLPKLYYSLILPHLQYCIILWGVNYGASIEPLVLLQKKAIRLITNSKFLAHTAPLFKKMNTLKLIDLVNI